MKNVHETEIINTCKSQQCNRLCCTKIEKFGVTQGNTVILKDVNMHIHCGELTAIIGPNGAGKSTLLKALLGEIPHTGNLHYVRAQKGKSQSPRMGYVPQSLNLDLTSPTSVMDLFLSSCSLHPIWLVRRKREVEKVMVRLSAVKADHLIDRRIGALSGGELQRVLLALALDPVPDLLLLDEPVSGIDQNGIELFYEAVSALRKQYDLSIILISHDMSMVQKYADRVVLLNQTVLKIGPPDEVLESNNFFNVFSLGWQRKSSKEEGGDL